MGFILTMWYVNQLQYLNLLQVGISFILTMWYVNILKKGDKV